MSKVGDVVYGLRLQRNLLQKRAALPCANRCQLNRSVSCFGMRREVSSDFAAVGIVNPELNIEKRYISRRNSFM